MDKKKGLLCPSCDRDWFEVIETRATSGGLRRRRECLGCGVRSTTVEIFVLSDAEGNQRGTIQDAFKALYAPELASVRAKVKKMRAVVNKLAKEVLAEA